MMDLSSLNREKDRIKRKLEKTGLTGICSAGLGAGCSLIGNDPDIRESGKRFLKECIEFASYIGSPLLCGVIYGGFGVSVGRSRTTQEWRWAVDSLQEISEYALKKNIVLCVEPINRYETYFLNTAEDGLHLVQEINRENVKLQLDTYQMNIEEKSFYTPIVKSRNYLAYLHCSENDRGICGTGHVDWNEVFRGLSDIDYTGWLVMESFYGYIEEIAAITPLWRKLANSPDEIASKSISFLKEKIAEYDL